MRRLIGVCAATIVVAGCSGGGAQPPPGLDTMTKAVAAGLRADGRSSWMSPQAPKTSRLLYVSQASTFHVDVYAYRKKTKVGQLDGLVYPSGLCSDKGGDVWIAEFEGFRVTEFAHGGTKPIARLRTDGHAVGCSVDPTTGDLAVADLYTPGSTGDIEVFKHASGTPTRYTFATFFNFWPPGYDDKGNLFVQGSGSNGDAGIAELPKGGSSLRQVSLNQVIRAPGGVMWDGKYVAATDQEFGSRGDTGIYRLQVSASGQATVVGSTELTDGRHEVDVVQPWIQGNVAIGCSSANRINYWNYPAGTGPVLTITGVTANGTTVSFH